MLLSHDEMTNLQGKTADIHHSSRGRIAGKITKILIKAKIKEIQVVDELPSQADPITNKKRKRRSDDSHNHASSRITQELALVEKKFDPHHILLNFGADNLTQFHQKTQQKITSANTLFLQCRKDACQQAKGSTEHKACKMAEKKARRRLRYYTRTRKTILERIAHGRISLSHPALNSVSVVLHAQSIMNLYARLRSERPPKKQRRFGG